MLRGYGSEWIPQLPQVGSALSYPMREETGARPMSRPVLEFRHKTESMENGFGQ